MSQVAALAKSHRISSKHSVDDKNVPFHSSSDVMLFCGDALSTLSQLPPKSIDCVVTSPPYYGQRDYGIVDQIGLESHPQCYIDKLVAVFDQVKMVLKDQGSLWVNIGDTYWSGKGSPQGSDAKQKHRRFERPQDRSGLKPWCVPKQLLLIPHRFAIAMQDRGWIVRNDNVWSKIAPTPDPVDDRCSMTHEYVFHFVKQRRYYFDAYSVAVPSKGAKTTKPPSSVWAIPTAMSRKKHKAVFPQDLVMLPIKATCPPNGTLLDPFCGSGTSLIAAITLGDGRKAVGIDINEESLKETVTQLHQMGQ